jgi:hypothetical protein
MDPPQLALCLVDGDPAMLRYGLPILVRQSGLRTLVVRHETVASSEVAQLLTTWHATPSKERVPCCLVHDSVGGLFLALTGTSPWRGDTHVSDFYSVRPGMFLRVYCFVAKEGGRIVLQTLESMRRDILGGTNFCILALVLQLRQAQPGEHWLTAVCKARDLFTSVGRSGGAAKSSAQQSSDDNDDGLVRRIERAMEGLRTFQIPDHLRDCPLPD